MITSYIDSRIKDTFNGEFFEIQIEGSYIDKTSPFISKSGSVNLGE